MKLFKKKTKQNELFDKIRHEQLDMGSLFQNINDRERAKTLYKELSLLCHPDKFPENSEEQEWAKEIFDKIQHSQTNYRQLFALQEEINNHLSNI